MFPCGTTSEGLLLSPDERREVVEEVIRSVDKKTPVVVHTGAMDLATTIELTRHARDCGALAASIVTPWYYLYDDEALFQYYRTVARAVDKFPILLYNIPACGRNVLHPELVLRLAEAEENIVGIKDSSGDMTLTSEFLRLTKTKEKDFKVFGGKDTLIYGALAHGADGAVATMANFCPELVVSIYEKYVAGDLKGSLEAQFRLNPVRLAMDRASFPVATKDMAKLLGLDVGEPFRPNLSSAGDVLEYMKKRMQQGGLLP